MSASPINSAKITVQELKGVNEREQHANNDLGYFDILKGGVPINKNTITKANGCRLLLSFGEPVLALHQTNDSRRNIIVQTQSTIQLITESQLFGIAAPTTNLVPIPNNEEESMSRAVIVHSLAAGTNGGTYTTANTWQQAPLSSIIEQRNPDGTAASFVTLAANQFTLSAGIYRISGYSVMANSTANARAVVRLFNQTTSLPAWSGLSNEVSRATRFPGTIDNNYFFFGGYLDLTGGSALLEVQGYMSAAQTNSGFGLGINSSPFFLAKEFYREVVILKTA